MVDRTDSNTELSGDPQGRIRHTRAFLELLDASVDVLLEEIFHSLTKHDLTLFLLVRKTCKADHLTVIDVEGSS